MNGVGCDTPVKAKIDTGAATSALHAPLLQIFERDSASWAAFTFRPHQRMSRDSMRVEVPFWRLTITERTGMTVSPSCAVSSLPILCRPPRIAEAQADSPSMCQIGKHKDHSKTKELQEQGMKINGSLSDMSRFFMEMAKKIKAS